MPGMWPDERAEINKKLDRIIELLEQLVGVSESAAERAELATHRDGCKCGRC